MSNNVLSFIVNLINSYNSNKITTFDLSRYNAFYGTHSGKNSANNMGAYLEQFIKDTFSNSLNSSINGNFKKSINKWANNLLDSGNDSLPPDALLKDGTAVEVKKMNKFQKIQLNSSPFHHDLSSEETRLSKPCRKKLNKLANKKTWEFPVLYIIGRVTKQNYLNSLIMFYGSDLARDNSVYNNIEQDVRNMVNPPIWEKTLDDVTGLSQIGNFNTSTTKGNKAKRYASKTFTKLINKHNKVDKPHFDPTTNELGKVKNVDTLGTFLRIRGMWILPNPTKFFKKFVPTTFYNKKQFSLVLVMSLKRWNKLNGDRSKLFSLYTNSNNLNLDINIIKGISLKNPSHPNNPNYNYKGVLIKLHL